MRKLLVITLLVAMVSKANAQSITRVEPAYWWVGMKNTELQLLVYGVAIADATVAVGTPYIKLQSVQQVANPNYLFLNLSIDSSAKPGIYDIVFSFSKKKSLTVHYELKARRAGSADRVGFNCSDVVYLIMPDRFANGDINNDNVEGMLDKLNRNDEYGRHGGDIQGIINNLDYLSNLGITSLWLTPVLECNQPLWSYHGYAITDFYRVDSRMGSNELYAQLVQKAHAKGLKVIKDLVFNHLGNNSWLIKDLPSTDWVNQWPEFTRTNYRIPASVDIHASDIERKLVTKGWFDNHMTDLNQSNPMVEKYLTQATIWWIEFANLDGIRVDTEPYCERNFIANWNTAIMTEYPNFNIVGETWVNYPAWVAYWQKDANNIDGYNSQTPTVMDFPLMYAVQNAFSEKTSWDRGLARLYEILAHDFIYRNPNNILVFADNHDVGRIRLNPKQSITDVKLALAFLLTTRGIPQFYYGTEVGIAGNKSKGDGDIRTDFIGGWPSDARSAFSADGRTTEESDIYEYTSKILNWRKGCNVVHSGKLTHFIPNDDIYVYFRHNDSKTVMVIINSDTVDRSIDTGLYNEFLAGKTSGRDIVSRRQFKLSPNIKVEARTALIAEIE